MTWIDVSVGLGPRLVTWPEDPAVAVTRAVNMADGHACTFSHLAMCAHSGTHVDAPLHYFEDGASVDQMPLEATVGPARVVDVGDADRIGEAEVMQLGLRPGARVLFRTRASRTAWAEAPFDEGFVAIDAAGARALVAAQVRAVGIDYLSVGAFAGDGTETHRVLLGAGIWVIGGLDLSKVEPGLYTLVCLPLKVLGAEGAPARAILSPRSDP